MDNPNSSKPPSSDPNRKEERKVKGDRKAGKKGRMGVTLEKVDKSDKVEVIKFLIALFNRD